MPQPATFIPHGGGEADDTLTLLDGGFWPDVSLSHFRAAMRVDDTVPDGRVKSALIQAAMGIINELTPLPAQYASYGTLEAVPAETIDGTSIRVHQFKAAIFNEAKAQLVETYRDFDSTESGHDQADKLALTICDYRRASRDAIRLLLDKPRAHITVI